MNRMFNLDEIIQAMADAYYAAAAKNAEMRSAAEALEAIRVAVIQEPDIFKTWYVFNEQIGRAEPERLQPALIRLRNWFEEKVYANEIARLHEIFHQDPEAGWKEWLRTYTEAFCYWRVDTLCTALIKESFRFPYSENQTFEMMKRTTKCVLHERWMEAYGLFLYLAGLDFIPNVQRAKLLVSAGEIQLYHFVKPDKARELFESAQNLAPNECRAICGIGEYWLNENEFEKAEEYFRRAITISPNSSDGYVNMGDSLEKKGKIDEAEEWFQKGIRTRDAGSSEYLRLVSLYGRPELFNKYRDRLRPIAQRAIAVDPSSRYAAYLKIGYCHQQNKEYEDAYRCYTKAIELDNTRLAGYASLGYAYIDEKKYDLARTNFLKVIEKAPEAHNGYWGMAWLCEREQEEKNEEEKKKLWEEALYWYGQCLKRRPEWEVPIRSSRAEIKRKLHRPDLAEEELFKGLRSEPENGNLLYSLHGMVDDYKKDGKPDAALRILETIHKIRGEVYEAEYHNRVGNVKYYFSDYKAAADAYIKAIAASPGDAVYHSNLSLAYEKMKIPGSRVSGLENAIPPLRRALELDPKNTDYSARIESLEKEKRLVVKFGEPVFNMIPILTPIAAEVTADLLPYILDMEKSQLSPEFSEMINAMRARIQERLGVKIPGIRFREAQDVGSQSNMCYIKLMDILVMAGYVPADKKFCPMSPAELMSLQINADTASNPDGSEGCWVWKEEWNKAKDAGISLWEPGEYMLRSIEALLTRNLAEFLGHQEVGELLANADPKGACGDIRGSPEKLTAFTQVLRGLVSEEVPITALNSICSEFVKEWYPGMDLSVMVEHIRSIPDLFSALPGNNNRYSFYRLGKHFEDEIEKTISSENGHSILSLSPEKLLAAMNAVQEKVGSGNRVVGIITENVILRPFIRKLIEPWFPNVPVLSRNELLSGLDDKISGVIELARTE